MKKRLIFAKRRPSCAPVSYTVPRDSEYKPELDNITQSLALSINGYEINTVLPGMKAAPPPHQALIAAVKADLMQCPDNLLCKVPAFLVGRF